MCISINCSQCLPQFHFQVRDSISEQSAGAPPGADPRDPEMLRIYIERMTGMDSLPFSDSLTAQSVIIQSELTDHQRVRLANQMNLSKYRLMAPVTNAIQDNKPTRSINS